MKKCDSRMYNVLIGSISKDDDKTMIKMIEFLGFKPILISGQSAGNPDVCRERLYRLITDIDFVVYNKRNHQAYTSWDGLEVRICDWLGIPTYTIDDIEDIVVAKAIGKEVNIKHADRSSYVNNICNVLIDNVLIDNRQIEHFHDKLFRDFCNGNDRRGISPGDGAGC